GVASATHYLVQGAFPIKGLSVRRALTAAPIVAGLQIYESSQSDAANSTGIIPMPSARDQLRGGHAVCIVGYDDQKRQFKFINSWGTGWGDHGYGYLPYDYPKIDFWQVQGIAASTPDGGPQPQSPTTANDSLK